MIEEENTKLSSFDQKAYLQLRLHQKLTRIDTLNINPLSINSQFGIYNYQMIFRDLCSILLDISSKLNAKEKELINKKRKELSKKMKDPLIKQIPVSFFRFKGYFNKDLWEEVSESLFEFRSELEILMDKHGFNPSKDDIRQSIIKM